MRRWQYKSPRTKVPEKPPTLIPQHNLRFRPKTFLAKAGSGTTIVALRKKDVIFRQGGRSEAVYYIQEGRVKLTVVSKQGKEATIALLGSGDFIGEECIASQPLRLATATANFPASARTSTTLFAELGRMIRHRSGWRRGKRRVCLLPNTSRHSCARWWRTPSSETPLLREFSLLVAFF